MCVIWNYLSSVARKTSTIEHVRGIHYLREGMSVSRRTSWAARYRGRPGLFGPPKASGRLEEGARRRLGTLNYRFSSLYLVYCLTPIAFCNSGILFTSHNGRTPTRVLSRLTEAPSLQVNFSLPAIIPCIYLASLSQLSYFHVNCRKSWIVRSTAQDWQWGR